MHPMTTWRLGWRTWLWIASAANAVLLLVWAGQRCFAGELRALVASVPDDSFYYVLPAFRFSECGFWSFDGEHPTFGVQPVYAWFLTLLAAFFEDRFAFFRVALWTNYVLFAATAAAIAGFLYRLLRPCGAFRAGLAAVVGAHGFLLNGTLAHGYTTLKESALYALLLVLSLWQAHRCRQQGSRRALLVCGVVAGLAMSCRITPSTLLIAGTTALFSAGGWRAKRLLTLAGGMALVVTPWAVHALAVHGRLLPTSGSLKMQPFVDAVRNGRFDDHAPALFAAVGPYLRDVFAYSLGRPSAFHLPQGEPAASVVATIFPFLLVGLLLVLRRDHALRACPGAWLVPASIAAATLGAALNPIFLGIERMNEVRHYYAWYIADLPVLLALLAPMAATLVSSRAQGEEQGLGPSLLAALVAAGLLLGGVHALRPLRTPGEFRPRSDSWTQIVAAAERVNELLEPGQRIGAYNAGVVGFLTEATVVNFDGLANDDIIQARARGRTILEYVQENDIRYLVDPLRPTGWFGNPFDRVEIVAAVPFRLDTPRREYYDGYFLLRVVDERFPDFEPRLEGGGVRVVPWEPHDPLGSPDQALRCFRFEPIGGRAEVTFHTLRAYAALDFLHGCEVPAGVEAAPILSVRDEAGELLYRSSSGRPVLASVPCHGADRLRVEVTLPERPGAPVPVTWLTGVSFVLESEESIRSEGEPFQAYGDGCDAHAQPDSALPRLEMEGDVHAGKLRYVCTHAPALATGTLAIGSAPLSQSLAGGCRGLVERTASTILIQLKTDAEGRGALEVTLPADVPSGFAYAQVVFRDPLDPRRFLATTNGVRILLPKRRRMKRNRRGLLRMCFGDSVFDYPLVKTPSISSASSGRQTSARRKSIGVSVPKVSRRRACTESTSSASRR